MSQALSGPCVGIDLGTTHTVVAAATTQQPASLFQIEQFVASGEVAARDTLPSVLYCALDNELEEHPRFQPPWLVGEFARRRAVETKGRGISSAKSWLSHAGVDRNAPILPWPATSAASARLSPVAVSERMLRHVVRAWDSQHAGQPLSEQVVVLTVPASFDQVARRLTLTAAENAGLHVRLLEEPVAAFYAWLAHAAEPELEGLLGDADRVSILVCDVGGGTTDLSLIHLARDETGGSASKLALRRAAVGRHLLLGGDNLDLALAQSCEPELRQGDQRLTPELFSQLVAQCRAAKERLLVDPGLSQVPLVLTEAGGQLVGATRRTQLTQERVQHALLQGFLPIVEREAEPVARAGLVGFGLPYERDPAITRHVARFLASHAPAEGPVAVLFNGGLFNARLARERVLACLRHWYGPDVRELESRDVNHAVALGAANFGLATLGHGRLIESSTTQSFFVGLESEVAEGKPAVCVIPRGSQEGESHLVGNRAFALKVGRPVRFELYASDEPWIPGDVVDVERARLKRLSPAVVKVEAAAPAESAGASADMGEVRVQLQGELSALGLVELACVPVDGQIGTRYRLSLDLHGQSLEEESARSLSKRHLAVVEERLSRVFGKGRSDVGPREARDLLRNLEQQIGPRKDWSLELNRAIFDRLISKSGARQRSEDHERQFWLLTGFCLRPGTGAVGDPGRAERLGRVLGEGVKFQDQARGWQQYWIAIRRAAAGLDETTQTKLRDLTDPHLAPADAKLKQRKGFRPLAPADMLEAMSHLERVPAERRAQLGRWILDRTWTDRSPLLWDALGRLGSRVPHYASAHFVVPPNVAERWLEHLLTEKWAEMPSAAAAAVQLARLTGDRSRDVSDAMRASVVAALRRTGVSADSLRRVEELVPVEREERLVWLGEDLPAGLSLLEG